MAPRQAIVGICQNNTECQQGLRMTFSTHRTCIAGFFPQPGGSQQELPLPLADGPHGAHRIVLRWI